MKVRGGSAFFAVSFAVTFLAFSALAQLESQQAPTGIRGIVINSVTREPIPRALVFSPDNRFATLTDSQGHFEFSAPQSVPLSQSGIDSDGQSTDGTRATASSDLRPWIRSGPTMLLARKPGFLDNHNGISTVAQDSGEKSEWTLKLIPEALLVGKVTLPTSDPPDSIQLELYRRIVQDGRARWVLMKGATSRSDGEFRFAELQPGTYKLLTRELLDRDPLTFDPRGQLYGYAPVYFPAAAGFSSAAEITLTAGETAHANFTLVRQPYYNVKIPVSGVQSSQGLAVTVFAAGNRGPGFALGYNPQDQVITGLLPNGTYTVEGTSFGPNNMVAGGSVNVTIHNGVVSGPALVLSTGSTIPVTVNEEFTTSQGDAGDFTSVWNVGGRSFKLTGPRRYLNLSLEPDDEFGNGRPANLRMPTGPNDQALVVENVLPGRYWVKVHSMRGYVASMRSGELDLLHQPLMVTEGGAIDPIQITIRDETSEIEGTIEGLATANAVGTETLGQPNASEFNSNWTSFRPSSPTAAHVYCVPLPDSQGRFTEMWVSADGHFRSAPLPPGSYRVLAFARPQSDLEYLNPEAMQAYASQGPVVRLAPGQKETVRVPLIIGE